MSRAPARLERVFLGLALLAWAAKVAVDGGAPPRLLSLALWLAAAAAAAPVVLRWWRGAGAGGAGWLDGWRLVPVLLALWMLPGVYGRLGGDGYEYYALLRSPLLDGDLDFRNDFAGLGAQPVLSSEGEVTSRTPIGMALLWLGPFLLAHAAGTLASWAGASANDGFAPLYQSTVTSASFVAGLVALALMEGELRRRHGAATALLAVLAVWLATPLHFYMVANPFMSHAGSVLAATLFVAAWLRARQRGTPAAWALTGAAGALMALVRVQDAVLLAVPLIDLALTRTPARVRCLAAFLAGPAAGGLLQLLVWLAMYGSGFLGVVLAQNWVGGGGLHVVDLLFAARHGLFTWTPLYVACVLGWLAMARREGRLALLCAAAFVLAVLVNATLRDWWGSHAFGQRRLLSLTPLFALGLGAALAFALRRPLVLASALLLPLVLWNLQFEYIFNSELISGKGQAVSLDRLAPAQVETAYWKLMRWERALPRRAWVLLYDNVKGVWLDEGPRSLRGVIDLGAEPEDVPALVGHNWYKPEQADGVTFRRSRGRRSWLRVPVRTPGAFQAVVRARSEMPGPLSVELQWNGRPVGQAALGAEWGEHAFTVPREAVRAGFNDVALLWSASPRASDPEHHGKDAAAAVDWLRLRRD